MPIRHDTAEKSASDGNGGAWLLKTGEDAVYGELSLETLAQWAETGRIQSDHEISRDGDVWVKAETVPELKMDWYATLKSGATHGPVNLLALPELYRRGIIDATAVLRNKLTNREIPAAALLRGIRDPSKAPRRGPPGRRIIPRPVQPPPNGSEAETIILPAAPATLPGVRLKGTAPPALAKHTDPTPEPAVETAPSPEEQVSAARNAAAPDHEVKRLQEEVERLASELRENKDRTAHLLKQLADETALHEQLRARHAKTVREMESSEKENEDRGIAAGLEERNRGLTEHVANLRRDLEEARLESRKLRSEIDARLEHIAAPRADEVPGARWRLRLDGNTLYGPVSESELYAWAADCRIGPGQEISPDGENWRTAESLPELRMQWYVTLVDGSRYGPLNALAVPHLIRDGVVAGDAPLSPAGNGDRQSLVDALLTEAAAIRERAAQGIEELRRSRIASIAVAPPRTIKDRLRANAG